MSVLLIGLDGASWTFIDLLRALSPSHSPVLWTTMATGRPPAGLPLRGRPGRPSRRRGRTGDERARRVRPRLRAYGHRVRSQGRRADGTFVAWGPAFRSGATIDAVSLLDVAPTVLHLLGLPVAQDMEGRVAEKAFAAARPVRWVATYETGRRATGAKDSAVDAEREQLRSLGYIK